MTTHKLDLGIGDVHVDTAVQVERKRPSSDEIAAMVKRSKRPLLQGDVQAIAMGFSVVNDDGDLVPVDGRIPTGPLPPDATTEDPGTWVSLGEGRYGHINFAVPKAVKDEAARGLAWRKEHGRGGTSVGVATARTLVSSANVTPQKARHIARYFPRHEVDKRGKGWAPGQDGYPSNGRIAWALWGGDPGRGWAEKLVRQMDAADAKKSKDTMATTLADLTTEQRKKLPASAFALPSLRKFPIHDAAHVRNAAARLEQAKKSNAVTAAQYQEAKANIAKAAKRLGIASQYLERDAAPPMMRPAPARRVHVRFTTPHGHHFEMAHTMADRAVFPDAPLSIDVSALAERVKLLDAVEAQANAAAEGSDARAAFAAEAVKLREEIAAPTWNQIAKVGTFRGHPAGPFELSPAIFDQIIRNYREIDGGKVPIDFEHASEADESSGSIPQRGAPAQGWVLDLANRGADGLWGLCRFLEPALTYVREGKYPFFSPAIRFGAKHPETGQPIGARLTSVGLVTRPFLRNMQPLAARDSAAPGAVHTMSTPATKHEMMKALKACMGLHPLATMTDMKTCIANMREHAKPILERDKTHAAGFMASGTNLGDYIHPLADLLGVPAHMTISDILDAVESMIDSAIERHEEEMHNMADIDTTSTTVTTGDSDVAVQLGQAKEQVRRLGEEKGALSIQLKAAGDEKAALSLKLKDAESTVATHAARIADLEAQITARDAADAARIEQERTARVESAFATYKDVKKLGDTDKAAMLIVLKADPATFERLYPPVAPNQQHLLRDLTGSRTPGGATAPQTVLMGGAAVPVTAPGQTPQATGGASLSPNDQRLLADKLMSEKKMPRETAISYAYEVAIGKRPMPAFAS